MLEPGQKLDLYVTALSNRADLSRGHADLCRVAHAIGIASSAASMRGIRPTSLFAPGPPLQAACTVRPGEENEHVRWAAALIRWTGSHVAGCCSLWMGCSRPS